MSSRRRIGPVEAGIRRDLRRLDAQAQQSGLAAAAVELARLLDLPVDSVGDGRFAVETVDRRLGAAAQATKVLRETMTVLLADAPREEKDTIDDLRARRTARAAG